MYMQDGKPIQIPCGRRNPGVTKIELDQVIADLTARIEALESRISDEQEVDDKPRRGRKTKDSAPE